MGSKKGIFQEDIFIGKTLRRLRVLAGMTQLELGNHVKVTFQQIQKYERGENHISPRRICQFAKTFQVSPLEFFEEKETAALGEASSQSLKLFRFFQRITEIRTRDIVINLVGEIARIENKEGV